MSTRRPGQRSLFHAALLLFMIAPPATSERLDDGALVSRVLAAERDRLGGCWLQAEEEFVSVLNAARPPREFRARALAGLAVLHADRGDLATGESLARAAIETAETVASKAIAIRSLVSVLTYAGPFERELPETILWLARVAEALPEGHEERILALTSEAEYAVLRRSPESLTLVRAAQRQLSSSPHRTLERANLLRIEAMIRLPSDPENALVLAECACGMLESVAPEGLSLASCANALAIARVRSGDHTGALAAFQRALAIRERLAPGGHTSAQVLMNIGTLLRLGWGDLTGAEAALRKALAVCLPSERATVLERLSNVLVMGGNPHLETETLCQMVDAVEARSLSGLPDALRQRIRWWDGYVSSRLGSHLARVGQPEAALEAIERARARAFVLAREERQAALTPNPPGIVRDLLARYEALQARLSSLDQGTQKTEIDDTKLNLYRMSLALELFETSAAVPRRSPRPLPASEILATLDERTIVLFYLSGGILDGQRTILIAAQKGEPVASVLLGSDVEIEKAIDRYRRLVARAAGGAIPRGLIDAGKELVCALFGSLGQRVSRASRLVICTDIIVSTMPFAALVVDDEAGRPVFFAERHAISHVTSLASLQLASSSPGLALDAELWSVGDPEGEGSSLPGARREVRSVAALHPGPTRTLVGNDAQESLVKSVSSAVGTIHIACHATSNSSRPEDSALVLATPRAGSPDNGKLQAREIASEMTLGADLVVLSACTSSGAFETQTEGPLGLARAFQIAGARRVLASRWLVPDEPTVLFMEAFYSARARGLAADRCLQEAQVALRSNPETAHPYYWAGFVLHGDGR